MMVWIVSAVVIIGVIFYWYYSDLKKDLYDLQGRELSKKFSVIVEILNQYAFNENGKVINIDNRSFNLYDSKKNQIIQFVYSTGHLTIIWRYKYFQKEIVHEKTFRNVRNLSIFEQEGIAQTLIVEMELVIEKHKKSVLSSKPTNSIPDISPDLTTVSDVPYFLGSTNPTFADSLEEELFQLKKSLFLSQDEFACLPEVDSKGRKFYYYSFGENLPINVYAKNSVLVAIAIPDCDYSDLTEEDLKEMKEETGYDLDDLKKSNSSAIQTVKSFFISKEITIYDET